MTAAPGRLAHTLELALHWPRHAGRVTATLALAGIVLAYSYEVVMRYVFSTPTWWSAELVSYLLCVVVFMMMPHVTATRGQVAVTALLERLGPNARWQMERLIFIAGMLVCGALAYFSGEECYRQISRGIQMMAAQPIPKWWVSIWIVIGFSLTTLEFARLALGGPALPQNSQSPDL